MYFYAVVWTVVEVVIFPEYFYCKNTQRFLRKKSIVEHSSQLFKDLHFPIFKSERSKRILYDTSVTGVVISGNLQ